MARLWSRKRNDPSGARADERRAGRIGPPRRRGPRLVGAGGGHGGVAAPVGPRGRMPHRSATSWPSTSATTGGPASGSRRPSDDELEYETVVEPIEEQEPDPYEVLGVEPTATWDEIVAAHRHQARVHHPDRLFGQSRRGEGGGRGAHPGHQRGLQGAQGPPRHVALRGARGAPGPARGGPPGSGPARPTTSSSWSQTTTALSTCLASQASRRASAAPARCLVAGDLAPPA